MILKFSTVQNVCSMLEEDVLHPAAADQAHHAGGGGGGEGRL